MLTAVFRGLDVGTPKLEQPQFPSSTMGRASPGPQQQGCVSAAPCPSPSCPTAATCTPLCDQLLRAKAQL